MREHRVPALLIFLALHCALGLAIGVGLASLAIMTNVAGLHDLIAGTSEPVVPMLLFYAFNALTFASVSMGIGVMTLPMGEPCDMRDPERTDESGPPDA